MQKTYKEKIIDKALRGKESPSYYFVPALYSWAWSLLLRSVCIPNESALEKTNFSFVSNYQLATASVLGMGTCVYFSSQHWDLIRSRPVQILHAASIFVSS